MSTAGWAEVVVNLAHRQVDHSFHYVIPEEMTNQVQLGSRVLVPFGRRMLEGLVVGFSRPPARELKAISQVLDEAPLLTPETLELARWMAERYLCPLAKALYCWLPAGSRGRHQPGQPVRQGPLLVQLLTSPAETGLRLRELETRAPRQAKVLQLLLEFPILPLAEVTRRAGTGSATVKSLERRGLVTIAPQVISPEQLDSRKLEPLVLTDSQLLVLDSIRLAQEQGQSERFLLHGITASGKTEIYLRSAEYARQRGQQVLVLVPEIALTPQLEETFTSRLGAQVAVLHSSMALGERRQTWRRISTGEAGVVLGARSAVLAPFQRLGLVVVDEEHEDSYRQDVAPKYHARELAEERARRHGAVLVLGSATPSVESYARAEAGELRLLKMSQRVGGQVLPHQVVVDMRQELLGGNSSIFSRVLQQDMQQALAAREQVVLFLNRRGWASFILCRNCGLVLRCPHCDVSLALHHAGGGLLCCHYCGYQRRQPAVCPGCGDRRIKSFNAGTQQVEAVAKQLFPDARVIRMDADTTRHKGAHHQIWQSFRKGQADVLVGTQMIAKGLDFPGVTLVGIISADITLNIPHFRARERTFQLLTQVAGRAGRGDRPGKVIIQTYAPQELAIKAASAYDFDGFIQNELQYRRDWGYPPFGHLVSFTVQGRELSCVQEASKHLAAELNLLVGSNGPDILGPAPAGIPMIKDRWRWQVTIKGNNRDEMVAIASQALALSAPAAAGLGIQIGLDIDWVG